MNSASDVVDMLVSASSALSAERTADIAGLLTAGLVASGCLSRRPKAGTVISGTAAGLTVALVGRRIVAANAEARQEVRDLWGLAGVMVDGRPWPAPGGWALGAAALGFLIREITARDLRVVIELGPGASSVILGRALPWAELHGVEHDPRFFHVVASMLRRHGLDEYDLVHAPLETMADGAREIRWYARSALADLPQAIDVLIVDGPPNGRQAGSRQVAWDVLGPRLSIGGLILVDDTHRQEERRMALEWSSSPRLDVLFDGGYFIVLECVA